METRDFAIRLMDALDHGLDGKLTKFGYTGSSYEVTLDEGIDDGYGGIFGTEIHIRKSVAIPDRVIHLIDGGQDEHEDVLAFKRQAEEEFLDLNRLHLFGNWLNIYTGRLMERVPYLNPKRCYVSDLEIQVETEHLTNRDISVIVYEALKGQEARHHIIYSDAEFVDSLFRALDEKSHGKLTEYGYTVDYEYMVTAFSVIIKYEKNVPSIIKHVEVDWDTFNQDTLNLGINNFHQDIVRFDVVRDLGGWLTITDENSTTATLSQHGQIEFFKALSMKNILIRDRDLTPELVDSIVHEAFRSEEYV